MKEIYFLKKNREKWKEYEGQIDKGRFESPDKMADTFIDLTDDLAYARTYYRDARLHGYLNKMLAALHRNIFSRRRIDQGHFKRFWAIEIPTVVLQCRLPLMISAFVFALGMLIGAFSAAGDEGFNRMILGDTYVNMTESNIANNDPLAVYKDKHASSMAIGITINNIRVAFMAFAMGLLFAVGAGDILFSNGVMLGSFHYMFHQHGLLAQSLAGVWIHGTLEITAIIIAGGAGMALAASFLFPGSYPRGYSFGQGAKKAMKLLISTIPMFIIAGTLEGFVTRHYLALGSWSWLIIGASALIIVLYFVVLPLKIGRRMKLAEGSDDE